MRSSLLVAFFLTPLLVDGELRLLQIVYQNGPPPPVKGPPKPFWQNGPAKFAVVGMFQLYRLGQRLRRKYSDFVHAEEVDLMERGAPCSSLAECFWSGFNSSSSSSDRRLQKLLDPELRCPRLPSARLYDSEEGSRILGENKNLYEYWSRNSGMQIQNPTDASELYHSLLLEKSLNLSVPQWVDRFWPELSRQSDIHFSWMAKNQEMQKMAAGPLLGLMVQRMQRHVDGVEHNKYFVYSGKNNSLAGLLAIFGAFDGLEPPLGSTVVLELHRFGHLYYVRVLFFFSSDPTTPGESPEVVILRDCSEYCPFDKFKRIATGLVPHNWEQQCGFYAGATPLVPLLSLLTLTLLILTVYK